MTDLIELLLQRARTIMPDLPIEQFELNQEGTLNDVLIVNREWVFRFAKTAEYARMQEAEMNMLDLLRPKVAIRVPTPVYRSAECVVYPLLGGQALTRKMLLGYADSRQEEIAAQMGSFLHALHTTRFPEGVVPATRAPVRRQNWLDLRQKVKTKIYPLLQKYQIEWAEDLFNTVLEDAEFFEYEAAFIHGDLAPYHFLFDEGTGQITGVIDFGMAGMGDAASDLGNLISIYGETFVRKMRKTYRGLAKLLSRARFYAQALEFEWVLSGLATGENFWFTAHLGGARDLQE